ncbi:MAG: protein phosphatase 2C domain-containing protein [Clostridiales bacterium]|nr:protein phosphatase 2C domain-containing protein [Clostridiales bacterium]
MNYFAFASTDVGIVKKTNQDSVCVKIAKTSDDKQIAMVVVCDGMGGLAKGELASATVIRRFSNWFDRELPNKINNFSWQNLSDEWTEMTREQNRIILDYGKKIGASLGTTLSVILIFDNEYMILHVGDSRVYEINDCVRQLTEDQTYINREINRGTMTVQEAKVHPKRNMLLQCVGASREVNPEILYGKVKVNSVFMVCSDGFRHVITNEEIYENFNPVNLPDENAMKQGSSFLIDLVKRRNERDNITVALLKCTD